MIAGWLLSLCASLYLPTAFAADKELLDILLGNGVITEEQHARLLGKASLSSDDILTPAETSVAETSEPGIVVVVEEEVLDDKIRSSVDAEIARVMSEESPVVADYGSKGFGFATRDGNFATNLQWRAQFRYNTPFNSDPRQLDDFTDEKTSSFEPRRLRMKIGGHGFRPWIKYYFEVDLQPARDVDADAISSGARVIDWRIDLAKWEWGGIRLGQWKVDLNRERVDSSGRQQFVERSIVNRVFTIDRQVGLQLRGRLFNGTAADLNYYAGVFNGEGRGVKNSNEDHLYMGRLQWNFLGRELAWRQTDVEFTEHPTGSFAIAGFTNEGACTRWSSSGCGNLDGFLQPAVAEPDQYRIKQGVQEFAFKYRGFSFQQEWHRKFITDRVEKTQSDLTGAYMQVGYFPHYLIDAFPAPLELAARYAYVEEPNKSDRLFYNEREEITLGANWFFNGHRNKLTLDASHLIVDDGLLNVRDSENRVRLQWDVSF
ncbi:phosphate-selective porin O and P [Luminiphilus syltensis NOR5-1B]|uniref:Phosphate-selective porin O and P n=2 Tax=Luminiphilus TaxID=1341118 RepID=B8KWD2_9GAMM|nr:phosphate-selective porin O and P [Luminiphilus syltensis NOR5-1B]